MATKSKHILTAVLAVLMFITNFVPISAFAAEGVEMDRSKAEVSWDYTLTDYDGNTFTAAYGVRAEDNPFGGAISPMSRRMHDYTAKRPGLSGDKSQWVYGKDYVYCFCIEHGVPLPNNTDYSGSSDPSHGNKYEMLSESQKNLLSLALAYGYPNRGGLETSKDANACYAATQLIVWQITLGFRTSPTQLNDRSYPMSGYIAKRPRAERRGAHGLFTDADIPINLSKVAEEVANHDGNVWTHIISLRREDAARLGYDNAYAWRNLLRSQAENIAENMKIPLTDLRWYAAYHDESYHPHVHMVV